MIRKGLGLKKGKGYKNMIIKDPMVHSMSAKGIKSQVRMNPIKPLSERQQQNKFYEKYIIDSIDSEPYDITTTTPKQKLQFLRDTFRNEYGF